MMHGDSRVMVVVCLETASLPAPWRINFHFPRSREEPKKRPMPGCIDHHQKSATGNR